MLATEDKLLLRAGEAARMCGLSRSTWYKNVAAGEVPAPVKIAGAVRWRRSELVEWIEAGCPPRVMWEAMNP